MIPGIVWILKYSQELELVLRPAGVACVPQRRLVEVIFRPVGGAVKPVHRGKGLSGVQPSGSPFFKNRHFLAL